VSINFLKPTLIFAVIGLFAVGLSAIISSCIQMAVAIAVDCVIAWKIVWFIYLLSAIMLPIFFNRYIKSTKNPDKIIRNLNIFNFVEYSFIQIALLPCFTGFKTLCFVVDGQNGIELVFTAWLSIPLLLLFSFLWKNSFKQNGLNINQKY
jgi:hypothetical protein